MIYQGRFIQVKAIEGSLAEMVFDRQGEAINKFDAATVAELAQAVAALAKAQAAGTAKGLLITSAKSVFIVGADITEFGALFLKGEQAVLDYILDCNKPFMALEDLNMPTVVAVNGYALGGGIECTLAANYRVMSTAAQVGVPEVKLGIYPGFGGTVRLARLAGPKVAIEWVSSGKPQGAEAAKAVGVVDEVSSPEGLRDAAIARLKRAVAGQLDWRARQNQMRSAVPVSPEQLQALHAQVAEVKRKAAPHQPAAGVATEMIVAALPLAREGAIRAEAEGFARVTQTQAAAAMVQTFVSDQAVKKLAKQQAKAAQPVQKLGVLGAGIMGGGISYTSALRGIAVRMKDVTKPALEAGLAEANKQLARSIKAGKMNEAKAQTVRDAIKPQLDLAGFNEADLMIEAVVEKLTVKHQVLAELEAVAKPGAIIASNTSSLRLSDMATALKQPERFVGLHFFNPVPAMPLVEVVRGEKTSEQAVATAVGYALAIGKTPIVVRDVPGFLVNRLLTAYMRGFLHLVADGADFERVDAVLESFGWPMGPAYLEDVIGIDTGSHVNDIISAGYSARMPQIERCALRLMREEMRLGQKNGKGFYSYERDEAGKPKKSASPEAHALIARLQLQGRRSFTEQEIIERTMLPLVLEAAWALEEGVVGTAAELDQALLLGLGFPAYTGGPLKYCDWLTAKHVVQRAGHWHAALGPKGLGGGFEVPAGLAKMAAAGARHYP